MNPFALIGGAFDFLFLHPVVNIMVLLLHGFNFVKLPGSLGLSIIALTIVIRFLTWPFMSAQLKSAKKMTDMKPHLDKLKLKHKGNKQAFATAQMALYKEHGVNPVAGCLPSLIQLPVLIALYQAIFIFFNEGAGLAPINKFVYSFLPHLEKMPDPQFLGFNLAYKPSEFGNYGWLLLLVPVVTAALQFVQSKMMMPATVKPYPSDSPKEMKEKKVAVDTGTAMQSQMMYMMPLMIGFFTWGLPVGLALYWNVNSIFGIIQQYKITGLGGLSTWIKKR